MEQPSAEPAAPVAGAPADPLTGAGSRVALDRDLAALVGSAQPLSLCLIDLDHFKSINDAFGHVRGDEVLGELGARLRQVLRATDLLYRYGGDEFVLLLPRTALAQATECAERLLDATAAEPFPGRPALRLSLSIGVAELAGGEAAAALFARADTLLYEAKRRGRGCVVASGEPTRAPHFDPGMRLVEREETLNTVRTFLRDLGQQGHGVLRLAGPPGSGRSQLLATAAQLAALLDHAVLRVRASPALRIRIYGALSEAVPGWVDADTPTSPAQAAGMILEAAAVCGGSGLVIAVDDAQELDQASRDALRALLAWPDARPIALIYTTSSFASIDEGLAAPLSATSSIGPFSPAGTALWLRGVLAWDPPVALVEWLQEHTRGLPAALQRALTWLIDRGNLVPASGGWSMRGRPDSLHPPVGLATGGGRLLLLPSPSTALVGRTRALRELRGLLARERLVSLVGPGGAGKTRLAIQAAAELSELSEGDIAFVPLDGLDAADQIPDAIAAALTLHPGPGAPVEALIAAMPGRDLLLVLDNLDQLLDGLDLPSRLLAALPSLRLLITSRDPLRSAGEWVVRLGGLDLGPEQGTTSDAPVEAVQMFVARAVQARPDWHLEPERAGVARICRLVDGLPLGIALAASWVPVLDCAAIAEAIEEGHVLLEAGHTGEGERGGMRAAIASFWRILSPDEQRVLRALSTFRGGFGREAAGAVAGASLFLLAALVDRAFLQRDPRGRFHLHEPLRQFGMAQLAAHTEEQDAARARHRDWYLALAERAAPELRTPGQSLPWLARLEVEHDNLRAALTWAATDPDLAARLAGALWRFWSLRGYQVEGYGWLERLIEGRHAGGGEDALRLPLLLGATALAWQQGDMGKARERAVEALRSAAALGDRHGQFHACNQLGLIATSMGDFARAQSHYDAALALSQEQSDRQDLGLVLNNLGNLAIYQGHFARARTLLEECLAVYRQAQHHWDAAYAVGNLAWLASQQADIPAATALAEEGLALFREHEDPANEAGMGYILGVIARAQGDLPLARALLEESLRVTEARGSKEDALLVLEALATVIAAEDAPRRAAQLLGAAEAARSALGLTLPAGEQAPHDQAMARLTAALDEAALARVWSVGQALSPGEAIRLALRD